ncbi:MAG TPA: tRNA (adenosine(37)-N6)-dimethylallyltransferase MiaA [Longimicrobium sp.]|jgi:tRNA dimethylallyltransferase|uniref:tRNA (adenosine(37)-N6)-dimethylallyltransferase MiaA n=1 Tax=Longimicrobium sp. TaxID=2029185 RepID=UPI002EDB42E0
MPYAALALVGPTASGKTALGIEVARRVDGEIISMDSRSVFRGMDVGTAKPTAEERAAVPHWGIDIADPSERFNAARWAEYARAKITEIQGRNRVPLLVGGTGFFLRALTHPIFQAPELPPAPRARITALMERMDDATVHRWLEAHDPESAERFRHWGGRQRLMRALEVPLLTGRPISWWHRNSGPVEEPVAVLPFVLDVPRDVLHARIDRRIGEMVLGGLLDEVRALIGRYGEDAPGLNAHGYAELMPYFRRERTLPDALAEVGKNTKSYTKRQRTWFRTQLPPGAVWLDATRPRAELADAIVAAWTAGKQVPSAQGQVPKGDRGC